MTTTTLARTKISQATADLGSAEQAQHLLKNLGYIGLAEAQARQSTTFDEYRGRVLQFLASNGWSPYDGRSVFRYQQEQILAMKASERPHDSPTSRNGRSLLANIERNREPNLSQTDWERKKARNLRTYFQDILANIEMVSKGEFLPAPDEVRLERVIRHFQNQLDLFEKNIDERNFDAFAISVDDGGSVFSWQWMEVPLNLYALPVPFPVLEHAAVIKKEFPEAEFTVEHLTNRNPLKLLSQPLLASFKSTIQGCLEPLVEEYQRQEQERLAQYEALRSMERESQRKQQAQREQAVAAAQVGAKRATALLDAATKVRKGSLALQDIDFKEHGVTAREVHWYLYDPFLKMRLRDDDGSYEDLYLFVWDEPGFQATILD